jgi:hypothetical protein
MNKRLGSRLPDAFLLLVSLTSQLGSLRERFPFPKKPRLHRTMRSFGSVIQTEREIGSKVPWHRGFNTRVGEIPKIPKVVTANLFSTGEKIIGRGFA